MSKNNTFYDRYMLCTVRLEVNISEDEINGIAGENRFGTAFFFRYNNLIFLVTNKHVVEGSSSISFDLRYKKTPNSSDYFSNHQESFQVNMICQKWVQGDEDLAISRVDDYLANLEKENQIYFDYQTLDVTLTPSGIDAEVLNTIEDVYVTGYPNNYYDEYNNLPVTMKGITASPCYINFNNKRQFLIDIPVFEGSSGSPVYLIIFRNLDMKLTTDIEIRMIRLLGVLSEGFYTEEDSTKHYGRLAIVEKSELIEDLINVWIKENPGQLINDIEV